MNKFEQQRMKLDLLVSRLNTEGMSHALEFEFEDLCSETAITMFLGPNQSISRNDSTDFREYADDADLSYYQDTFENIDYRPFFKNEPLGNVILAYEVREIQGLKIPALRITFERKYAFFKQLVNPEQKNEIDLQIKFFSTILGCRWYDAKVETIRIEAV